MLTTRNLSKGYGGRELFNGVNLQINRGDRLGLVGPNGAGKSTLFSIMRGALSPDDGEVAMERNAQLGFLAQETGEVKDETVIELATAVSDDAVMLRRIALHQAEPEGDLTHDEAHSQFDEIGGFTLEPKARRILKGLAFRDSDMDRKVSELSGGWIMRAHLARLLVQEPDLLMLDEPTNHLDLETVGWVQSHLKSYRGALLMISHDREFLNALITGVLDIRLRKVNRYKGNYDQYLVEREARAEQHQQAYENQQKEMQRLKRFADRFIAKASKSSQAKAKLRQIDRMEIIEAPQQELAKINFSFPQPKRSGQRVIELTHIHQSYGDLKVYEDLDFACDRKERIVLVGPNGAGKSTLLKLLGGVLDYQQGERKVGHNTEVGYYSQNRLDMLSPGLTVLESAMEGAEHSDTSEQQVRTILGSFLFKGDDVFKQVSVLSGGEKSRLALVRFLVNPPNLLLMDEPTTHLDMDSIEALIMALKQYEGTLVFISHDVYFIKSIAEKVVHISAGKPTSYAGDYDYFLYKTGADNARAALTAGEKLSNSQVDTKLAVKESRENSGSGRKTKEQKRQEAEERKVRSAERKKVEAELEKIESQIAECEQRQEELTKALQDPETFKDAEAAKVLHQELTGIQPQLEKLYSFWETVSEKQAALG